VVLHEEVCLSRPDGKRITKLVNAAPVHDERGSIVAAIAVFQDITAIKDAEQLKDDFLSLVSHELRTPLTTIHGGAHLLLYDQEQLDAETQQMLLADLFGESRRLATLIENMVQLGQIRAGRFQLETEPVHVAKLVEGAIRAVQEAAPDRRFAVEVEPDLLAAGDPGRLEQVLRNLLTNAVKYSPPGSLIEVGATAADDEVMIAVRDQGAGIAEEDLGRIFERFERGAQGRSGTASGMGLGLYLAKQIVEAQGGRIWVEQPVDGGTRVRLTMPSLSEET
jgi:signal transduction histidine kinase